MGHEAVLSGLSLLVSDMQKPRIHPRPGPERLLQSPYLILPQCYHLPRPSATPGMEQMELSGDSSHHLLRLRLEMALWGAGYIPWHWRSQFLLSINSSDKISQGLETEAGRQCHESAGHPAHSLRVLRLYQQPMILWSRASVMLLYSRLRYYQAIRNGNTRKYNVE